MKKEQKATKKGPCRYYHISSVAEMFEIHPQTLRLYEREGLLAPSRSEGNTRLYSAEDLKRLEIILNLIRDLGVNLAGVEVILNMRAKIEQIEAEEAGTARRRSPYGRRLLARSDTGGAGPRS